MGESPPTFSKDRLAGLIAVLSFGLTALFAVLGFGVLVPVTFILGFFILLPLVYLFGEDFPLVEPSQERAGDATADRDEDPVEALRRRYAEGKLSEAEFERRLERLLETEDAGHGPSSSGDDRVTELERELE